MTKRPWKVHLLFRDKPLCGVTGPQSKDKRGRYKPSLKTTKEPREVTCVSCHRASDRMLRTNHKDFKSWMEARQSS